MAPLATGTARSLSVSHLWWPLAGFALAFVALVPLQGDFWWADRLFALSGHRWSLEDYWLTERVLHVGGRNLSILAWLLVLCTGMASLFNARLQAWRRPLLFLLLATALTTLLVGALKHVSGMDCPWDLLRYGGHQPFVGLFEARPPTMPRAACFPAGHASSGFGWVALYFFWLAVRPQWRWRGLATGVIAGAVFGMAQQLRGAHFLSHDVTTLAIAWFTSVLLFRLMKLSPQAAHVQHAAVAHVPATFVLETVR